jgi:uncharacterized protein YkwD
LPVPGKENKNKNVLRVFLKEPNNNKKKSPAIMWGFCKKNMKSIIIALLSIVITPCISQTDSETFYSDLNSARSKRLIKTLTVDSELEKESEAWLIKTNGKLWHDHSINKGEVLARSWRPFTAWMKSKGHKKTMLRRKYRYVGYAFRIIDGKPMSCARFR